MVTVDAGVKTYAVGAYSENGPGFGCAPINARRIRLVAPADLTGRVTRVRYQELCFSTFVLRAAIASDNCRHAANMRLRQAGSSRIRSPQSKA